MYVLEWLLVIGVWVVVIGLNGICLAGVVGLVHAARMSFRCEYYSDAIMECCVAMCIAGIGLLLCALGIVVACGIFG